MRDSTAQYVRERLNTLSAPLCWPRPPMRRCAKPRTRAARSKPASGSGGMCPAKRHCEAPAAELIRPLPRELFRGSAVWRIRRGRNRAPCMRRAKEIAAAAVKGFAGLADSAGGAKINFVPRWRDAIGRAPILLGFFLKGIRVDAHFIDWRRSRARWGGGASNVLMMTFVSIFSRQPEALSGTGESSAPAGASRAAERFASQPCR